MVFNDSPTVLGQTTTLTANILAGSSPITFSWNFGDGETAFGQTVNHTFQATGNYTTIVTASNAMNSLNQATTVIINSSKNNDQIYLPLIFKPELTDLYVFNNNTGGDLQFTVVGANVSCIVQNNTTQFCGSFLPGTYLVETTTLCGPSSKNVTYNSGSQTQPVSCP